MPSMLMKRSCNLPGRKGLFQKPHQTRCCRFLSICFSILHADVLEEFLRAYSRPVRKKPLKMEWAQVHFFRHLIKIGLLFKMLLNVSDGVGNAIEIDVFLRIHPAKFITQKYTGCVRCKPDTCAIEVYVNFVNRLQQLWSTPVVSLHTRFRIMGGQTPAQKLQMLRRAMLLNAMQYISV